MSGVSNGLGLGLGFSHILELWFWCFQVLLCPWDNNVTSCIVAGCSLWWYFIEGLVPGLSHGLGVLVHCRVMVFVFTKQWSVVFLFLSCSCNNWHWLCRWNYCNHNMRMRNSLQKGCPSSHYRRLCIASTHGTSCHSVATTLSVLFCVQNKQKTLLVTLIN